LNSLFHFDDLGRLERILILCAILKLNESTHNPKEAKEATRIVRRNALGEEKSEDQPISERVAMIDGPLFPSS
jgi:hypothetical protein